MTVSAAGIFFGENDFQGVTIQFRDPAGNVIHSRHFPPFSPRSGFYGIESPTPIGSMEVLNAAFDGDGMSFDDLIFQRSGAGVPSTLILDPPAATNPVGSTHCVTATVRDVLGNPVSDVAVHFTVMGSVNASATGRTSAEGQIAFCYPGPALPGGDAITAFADTDEDDMQDPEEPAGVATKAWVLPPTTPLYRITIGDGGWITTAHGDQATFGGHAKASETGETQGQEEYQDHGPAQPMNFHSLTIEAIVCEGTMQASIYGQATVGGSGSYFFRIRVQDLSEPGVGYDTYGIILSNGYNSGEQTLEGGNVQIHRD